MSATQREYFTTAYYNQSGGYAGSQSSGYIYSSFSEIARLWWNPNTGVQGAIYSTIDDVEGPNPIAEVDNASRVIKYVVTLGYRYQLYNPVDLRLHDVNVVADLNRHEPNDPNPTEPVECDGTSTGYRPASAAVVLLDSIASLVKDSTRTWWTGWWPVYHILIDYTTGLGDYHHYELAIDLLGTVSVVAFEFSTPADDCLTDSQLERLAALSWKDFLSDAFPLESSLMLAVAILGGTLEVLMARISTVPTPTELAVITVLIVLWTTAMFAALLAVQDGVLTGRISPGVALEFLMAAAVMLFFEGILDHLMSKAFYAKYWITRGLSWGFRGVWLILLSIALTAIKMFLLAIVLSMMDYVFRMCIEYYNLF